MEKLTWLAFKQQLQTNPGLNLQFKYAESQWIDAAYHITEIKQAPVTSVDCGGVLNSWTEIIVQLWVPEDDSQQDKAMPVSKALSIIGLVEKILPLNPNAIIKIEFGHAQFDTRQMLPHQITVSDQNLIVDLNPDMVQCKAIARGGSCGTDATKECCTPVVHVKPAIQLKNLVTKAPGCTPGYGCC